MIKSHFMYGRRVRNSVARRPLLVAGVLVLLAVQVSVLYGIARAEDRTIKIAGTENPFYKPPDTEVNPGDTVRWTNEAEDGLVHTATSDNGTTFNTGPVNPGATSRAFTLNKPGTYRYHCERHPNVMKGVITVKSAPDPPESPDPTGFPSPIVPPAVEPTAPQRTSPTATPEETESPTPTPTPRESPSPSPTPLAADPGNGSTPVAAIATAAGLLAAAAGVGGWLLWRRMRSRPS